MLELLVDGLDDTFEIAPAIVDHRDNFVISVKNSRNIDYETNRTLDFKIAARELGLSKLTATARVTVNVLDANDQRPVFEQDEYVVYVHENEPEGSVILTVKAEDGDSGALGEVRYTRLLSSEGDDVVKGLRLDPVSGEIVVVNNEFLDREKLNKHILGVEAEDQDPNSEDVQVGEARILLEIVDVNDERPIFTQNKYEAFMNVELSGFRNDLRVEAIDKDQPGSLNSAVKYEIIRGNYENKFSIDEDTGRITVERPLADDFVRGRQQEALDVEPVITLTVRAHDQGVPVMWSETNVLIYTTEVAARAMRFLLNQNVQTVQRDRDEITELISEMTGGEVEIQDIQPYIESDELNKNSLNNNNNDSDSATSKRNPKAVELQLNNGDANSMSSNKTVIDVLVRYGTSNSLVDVNAVSARLNSSVLKNSNNEDLTKVQVLEQRSAALFWALIVLLIFVAIAILIVLCCLCCTTDTVEQRGPKRSSSENSNSGSEMGALRRVINSEAEVELKESRFRGAFRSARERIRSATTLGRSSEVKRFHGGSVEPRTVDDRSLYSRLSRHRLASRRITPLRHYDDDEMSHYTQMRHLDAEHLEHEYNDDDYNRRLRRPRVFKLVEEERRRSSRQGGQDVQILRLDDSPIRALRHQELRRSDSSESAHLSEPRLINVVNEEPVRRSQSEMGRTDAISSQLNTNNNEELYTAIGPDGKQIILKRYHNKNDKGNLDEDRGFLQMALMHLENERKKEQNVDEQSETISVRHQALQTELSSSRNRATSAMTPPKENNSTNRTMTENNNIANNSSNTNGTNTSYTHNNVEPALFYVSPQAVGAFGPQGFPQGYPQGYSYPPHAGYPYYYAPGGYPPRPPSPPRGGVEGEQPRAVRKKAVRTPILEETESGLRRELDDHDRYALSYDDSNASVLRFRIQDTQNMDSPEPAYTETKSSILRRRNTKAKMLLWQQQQEEQLDSPRRHVSLSNLASPSMGVAPKTEVATPPRRWRSIANDELVNRPRAKFSLIDSRISRQELQLGEPIAVRRVRDYEENQDDDSLDASLVMSHRRTTERPYQTRAQIEDMLDDGELTGSSDEEENTSRQFSDLSNNNNDDIESGISSMSNHHVKAYRSAGPMGKQNVEHMENRRNSAEVLMD